MVSKNTIFGLVAIILVAQSANGMSLVKQATRCGVGSARKFSDVARNGGNDIVVFQGAKEAATAGENAPVIFPGGIAETAVHAQKGGFFASLLIQGKTSVKDYARLANAYASQFKTQVARLNQFAYRCVDENPAASYGLLAATAVATAAASFGTADYVLRKKEAKRQLAENVTVRGLLLTFGAYEVSPEFAKERMKNAGAAVWNGLKSAGSLLKKDPVVVAPVVVVDPYPQMFE